MQVSVKQVLVLTEDGAVIEGGLRVLRNEHEAVAYGTMDPRESVVAKIFAVLVQSRRHGEDLGAPDLVEVEQRHISTGDADEQDYLYSRYGLFRPGGTEPLTTFAIHIDGRA